MKWGREGIQGVGTRVGCYDVQFVQERVKQRCTYQETVVESETKPGPTPPHLSADLGVPLHCRDHLTVTKSHIKLQVTQSECRFKNIMTLRYPALPVGI
jgi:hypothetical protein